MNDVIANMLERRSIRKYRREQIPAAKPRKEGRMNLPVASHGVSCKRCLIYEVRSARKLFNCGL
jgi:hypothetical protein